MNGSLYRTCCCLLSSTTGNQTTCVHTCMHDWVFILYVNKPQCDLDCVLSNICEIEKLLSLKLWWWKFSSEPWIWHGCDASSDESFHPLRLGPITINITQSASEKDNRKKITSSLNLCLVSDEQSGFSLHVFNSSERAGGRKKKQHELKGWQVIHEKR